MLFELLLPSFSLLLCLQEPSDFLLVTSFILAHSHWRWHHLEATYIAQEWTLWIELLDWCSISDKLWTNLQKKALFCHYFIDFLSFLWDVLSENIQIHMFWIDSQEHSESFCLYRETAQPFIWMSFRRSLSWFFLIKWVESEILWEHESLSSGSRVIERRTHEIQPSLLDHIWEWKDVLTSRRENPVQMSFWVENQYFSCLHYIENAFFWNKKEPHDETLFLFGIYATSFWAKKFPPSETSNSRVTPTKSSRLRFVKGISTSPERVAFTK